MSDSPERKSGGHIPSLDGLRALSFSLVFLGHAGLGAVIPTAFGVTVFFFLSGYLITTLLRHEEEKSGTISLKNFYVRRALRILPPFYLVLLLALICRWVGLLPAPAQPASLTAVLLHYANYYIVARGDDGFLIGTGVYWSLAVEEHFYFLFPAFYLYLVRRGSSARARLVAILCLCAGFLAWRLFLHYALHATFHRTGVASDTRFDSILFGCALAVHGNPWRDPTNFSERTWKAVFFPLGIAGLVASFLIRNDSFRETVRYTVQGVCLVPVFVCAVRYPEWLPMRALNTKPLAFVGALSYSLYLMHVIVLGLLWVNFGDRMGLLERGIAGLAITLALAWIFLKFVEEPAARLRARFTAPAAAPSSAFREVRS